MKQDSVQSIKTTIETREIAKSAEDPHEHAYLITYDLKAATRQDVVKEVLIGLKSIQLTASTIGFISNLHPDEIKECFGEVIAENYDRLWIVTAASPFDGKGEDVEHNWLWAMPDYDA